MNNALMAGTKEEVSLFCFLADAEQREGWKQAIQGQDAVQENVIEREKHSPASNIIRSDPCILSGDAMSIQSERPKPRTRVIPWVFEFVWGTLIGGYMTPVLTHKNAAMKTTMCNLDAQCAIHNAILAPIN